MCDKLVEASYAGLKIEFGLFYSAYSYQKNKNSPCS